MSAEYTNQVHVLHAGYSRNDYDNPTDMRANCTCTLIRTHGKGNIIVDTMTAWDGQLITNVLKKHGLEPSDIDSVVCTHGHADHIGCNYLFTDADWHIVGASIHNRDRFLDWNFVDRPFELGCEHVEVIATPGHTLSCVSVLVHYTNLGCVGVCGDLFERMEDIEDSKIWMEAGSENVQVQRKNRLMMGQRCDYIVPGHGPGFKVTDAMRVKLWHDVHDSGDRKDSTD